MSFGIGGGLCFLCSHRWPCSHRSCPQEGEQASGVDLKLVKGVATSLWCCWEVWNFQEVGSSGRKLGDWGYSWEYLDSGPLLSPSLLPGHHEVSSLFNPTLLPVYMVYCVATGPKQWGPATMDWSYTLILWGICQICGTMTDLGSSPEEWLLLWLYTKASSCAACSQPSIAHLKLSSCHCVSSFHLVTCCPVWLLLHRTTALFKDTSKKHLNPRANSISSFSFYMAKEGCTISFLLPPPQELSPGPVHATPMLYHWAALQLLEHWSAL
jgi:hypothetical protein